MIVIGSWAEYSDTIAEIFGLSTRMKYEVHSS